jgi:hypothetical protein
MAAKPLVSIIVLNYNGEKCIRKCLKSLLSQTYPNYEIIVVDNASTDSSPEIVKKEFPQLKFITNNKNLGFAAGNNVGIKEAKGELIAIFNPDAIAEPNWLSELVNAINSSSDIGIAGGVIYYYEPSDVVWSAGGKIDIFTGLDWHPYQGEKIKRDHLERTDDIDYIPGCALLIKKEVLEKVGLLDETYFLYFDDLDIALCAKRVGYKCSFVPFAVVYHMVSFSWHGRHLFGYYHQMKYRFYLYFKHFPFPFLITSIIFQGIFTIFEIVLFKRPISYAATKFSALKWNLFNIQKILKKRKVLQKIGKFSGRIRFLEVLKVVRQRIGTKKYYW